MLDCTWLDHWSNLDLRNFNAAFECIFHPTGAFEQANRLQAYPTGPFTMFDPHDQEIGEFYVLQERRTMGFKAL